MLTNVLKFLSKNNCLKKKLKFRFFQKGGKVIQNLNNYPYLWNPPTQKYKVSGTSLKLSQYLRSYKTKVNLEGHKMANLFHDSTFFYRDKHFAWIGVCFLI